MWALLIGAALAGPVAGECSRHIPIRRGEAFAPALSAGGVAKCTAVAVPLSELAGYLKLESRLGTADKLHALDVSILERERDYYRAALEKEQTRPWYRSPAAYRWAGRADILIVAVVLTGTATAAYRISR